MSRSLVANFTFQITGVPELVRKLGQATANSVLERAMNRGLARMQATLQKYPSPPPSSTYTRTGDLGRNWATRPASASSGGVQGQIGNAVRGRRSGKPYAKFVQGAQDQAAIHQGRWKTDEDAWNENRSAIEHDFSRAIDDALR